MPEMPEAAVTKEDIIHALREVGVEAGDILLTHSSMKSFGRVSGGPMTVIEAAKETVTEQGTTVFPTLVQRDFLNAYRNWDIHQSPSDVGLITETFRLLPDSVRSDQATHSVAAWGRQAIELTDEHSAYGPRMGVFGDYCFSYSSPWQKMYLNKARIVFIGVGMEYNTCKHLAEYMLVERYVNRIKDQASKCLAMSKIARHGVPGIWPFHDAGKTQSWLDERGLIQYTTCGQSRFISIRADQYIDHVVQWFQDEPEQWFSEDVVAWIEECRRAAV